MEQLIQAQVNSSIIKSKMERVTTSGVLQNQLSKANFEFFIRITAFYTSGGSNSVDEADIVELEAKCFHTESESDIGGR